MSRKTRTTLTAIEKLIDQRRQLEDWLVKLDDGSTEMPAHVIERVRNDYRARLAGVIADLGQHQDAVREMLTESQERYDGLQADESQRQDELAELRLRRKVGELDEVHYAEQASTMKSALDAVTKDRNTAQRDIERFEDILETIAAAETPPEPEPVVEYAAEAEAVPSEPVVEYAAEAEAAPEAEPAVEYGEPAAEAAQPAAEYAEPVAEAEYAEPVAAAAEPEAEYAEPVAAAVVPEAEYAEPEQVYAEPELQYAEPAREHAPEHVPEPPAEDEGEIQIPMADEPPPVASRRSMPAMPQVEDEMAFLRSVVSPAQKGRRRSGGRGAPGVGVEPAQGSVQASAAGAVPIAEEPVPRDAVVEPTAPTEDERVELQAVAHMVRFSGPHADEPPAPPKADEDANRTLECKHCGAKNRPTEWYCEKCGAELSTL